MNDKNDKNTKYQLFFGSLLTSITAFNMWRNGWTEMNGQCFVFCCDLLEFNALKQYIWILSCLRCTKNCTVLIIIFSSESATLKQSTKRSRTEISNESNQRARGPKAQEGGKSEIRWGEGLSATETSSKFKYFFWQFWLSVADFC